MGKWVFGIGRRRRINQRRSLLIVTGIGHIAAFLGRNPI
jgi:hypothetical protein